MKILLVSCSLDDESRSRLLIHEAARVLESYGADADLMDLREPPLPFCSGEEGDEMIIGPLRERIVSAGAILMGVPIYNYDVNAAAKNLVELTGSAWENKVVGFLCAAGGHGSYMSVMSLANSLMLDFRCLIVPRFVYAIRHDFEGDAITSTKVMSRTDELCRRTLQLANAMAKPFIPNSD